MDSFPSFALFLAKNEPVPPSGNMDFGLKVKSVFSELLQSDKSITDTSKLGFIQYVDDNLSKISLLNPQVSLERLFHVSLTYYKQLSDDSQQDLKYKMVTRLGGPSYTTLTAQPSTSSETSIPIAKVTSRKRRKKTKIKKGPKKPLTAYTCFIKDRRGKIMRDNPQLNFQQVASLAGKYWQELRDEDRMKYQLQSQDDKRRYEREMAMSKDPVTEVLYDAIEKVSDT